MIYDGASVLYNAKQLFITYKKNFIMLNGGLIYKFELIV